MQNWMKPKESGLPGCSLPSQMDGCTWPVPSPFARVQLLECIYVGPKILRLFPIIKMSKLLQVAHTTSTSRETMGVHRKFSFFLLPVRALADGCRQPWTQGRIPRNYFCQIFREWPCNPSPCNLVRTHIQYTNPVFYVLPVLVANSYRIQRTKYADEYFCQIWWRFHHSFVCGLVCRRRDRHTHTRPHTTQVLVTRVIVTSLCSIKISIPALEFACESRGINRRGLILL